jgi:hypothetical protein
MRASVSGASLTRPSSNSRVSLKWPKSAAAFEVERSVAAILPATDSFQSGLRVLAIDADVA